MSRVPCLHPAGKAQEDGYWWPSVPARAGEEPAVEVCIAHVQAGKAYSVLACERHTPLDRFRRNSRRPSLRHLGEASRVVGYQAAAKLGAFVDVAKRHRVVVDVLLHGGVDDGVDGGGLGCSALIPPVGSVVVTRDLFQHLQHRQRNDLGRRVVQKLDVATLKIPEKVGDASVVRTGRRWWRPCNARSVHGRQIRRAWGCAE